MAYYRNESLLTAAKSPKGPLKDKIRLESHECK